LAGEVGAGRGGAGAGLLGSDFSINWLTSKLSPMLPFRVQDAKHNDALAFHAIEKFVRKSACEQSAKISIVKWTAFRVGFQPADRRADFNQQFIT
jgi:hypothetical protein